MRHKIIILFLVQFGFLHPINSLSQKSAVFHPPEQEQMVLPPANLAGEDLKNYIINFFSNVDTVRFNFKNPEKQEEYLMDSLYPKVDLILDAFEHKQFFEEKPFNATNSKAEKIYEQIFSLRNKYKDQKVKEEYELIKKETDALPSSSIKVWLTLYYASYNLDNTDFFKNVNDFANAAGKIAFQISDIYDATLAHCYIGNFCSNFQEEHTALRGYFYALENIDSLKSIKYSGRKLIYDSLAGVISRNIGMIYQTVNLEESYEKCIQYFQLSKNLFDSAKQNALAFQAELKLLNAKTIFYYDILPDEHEPFVENERLNILNDLFYYYNNFLSKNNSFYLAQYNIEKNYYILESLAEIFLYEDKPKTALRFFLTSFINSSNDLINNFSSSGSISYILSRVAYTYSLIGNKNLSEDYINLSIRFAEKEDNRISYFDNVLTKANIFTRFNQFDSALTYAHWVEKDTTIHNILFPIFYQNLMEEDYNALSEIFYSENNNDSSLYYKNLSLQYTIYHYGDFADLLQDESSYLFSAMDRSDGRAIFEQSHLKELAEKNEVIQKKLRVNAEKIAKLSQDKSMQDSISRRLAQIHAKEMDSVNKKIETDYKTITELNAQKNRQNTILFISLGALSLLTATLVFLISSNKKKSKERLEATSKELTLRSAIKNHNLSSHYSKLKTILREGRIMDAIAYSEENSRYFEIFYKTSIKDIVSLEEEKRSFDRFVNSENIYKKLPIDIIYENDSADPAHTKFLSDIFASLYENALKYAFVEKRNDYFFKIQLLVKADNLICLIADNGTGNPEIASSIRSDSYLSMLRDRVYNYHKLLGKKVSKEEIFQIQSNLQKGTEIQIILPYETI